MIEKIMHEWYNFDVISYEKMAVGAGSDTYIVDTAHGKYVLKFPCSSEINCPEIEPDLCDFLHQQGLAVSEFMTNINGEFICKENDKLFHLQKYVFGDNYNLNTAPQWLMKESAQLLGKIHTSLEGYHKLTMGIGENFFKYMTPHTALSSYKNTLKIAEHNGDNDIAYDLKYRIEFIQKFPNYSLDISKLTCKNTHGDYFISQIICGKDKINAIIDWTTACVHPVVWEIIRSFVYSEPSCTNGEIDISKFIDYVREYLKSAELSRYDIATMPKLFYYQIAVCDYYNQYYQSTSDNRNIYLHQAVFSTKLMKWFENHIDELICELEKIFY